MRPPASRMISAPAAMSHLLEPELPERVDATGRDVAEIERRGAGPADARGLEHHGAQHVEVAVEMLQVRAIRKARRDQSRLQRRALAHADLVAVELRALAAARAEDLLAQRIVDDAVLDLARARDGDRHGEHRKAVHVVRRAVERIDDPLILVVAARAALLGEDRVLGIVVADDLDDRFLGRAIDLSDELVAALLLDA